MWGPGGRFGEKRREFLLMVSFLSSVKSEVPSWAEMGVGGGWRGENVEDHFLQGSPPRLFSCLNFVSGVNLNCN